MELTKEVNKTKELNQIVERVIGGVKFKYKQVYHLSDNNAIRYSGKQVKQNNDTCKKAYVQAIS